MSADRKNMVLSRVEGGARGCEAPTSARSRSPESAEERIVVVYEEHFSRGLASTTFRFNPEPLTEPIFVGGGTHRKYLAIVKKGTQVTVTRVSNRGNITVKRITIDAPVFIDFLGNTWSLDEQYIEYAKSERLM
ncbi:MAG: hypothetical protein QXG35_07260 [Nitrososphaerota archaeon]